MNEAIEKRELLVLNCLDVIVRGTYHKTYDESFGQPSNLIERDRVGVLFLNSLSPTRAGKGDSSVYWADSLARRGYPSFRLDLPGFGDSDEDPPNELLDFINRGGYANIASAIMKELVRRFALSGVVIVGLCAGAVTAICTATVTRECSGLVLLDPYFHLPLAPRSKLREKLTGSIPQGALRRLIKITFDRVRTVRVLLVGSQQPCNSNFPLINRWTELASAGLPILVFKTPTIIQRGGEFDYVRYNLERAGRNSQVVVKVIEGADHTFANRLGRTAVRQHTELWLNAYFPLIKHGKGTANAVRFEPDDDNGHNELHENGSHRRRLPWKVENQQT